jgi:pimeloyl-ACP methyl ester carboxylesterase
MSRNNTWIVETASETVFIFVHGILSSSETCWRNPKTNAYWPELVAQDSRLCAPSVFVSGYTADIGAGILDAYDAAQQAMAYLDDAGQPGAPLRKSRIVFVCHSQGGIVVRQMLLSFTKKFRDKKVGLVLCGSPSWGSLWATALMPFALLLRFRQAKVLKWAGPELIRLDRDFMSLLDDHRVPGLTGMCLVETRGAGPFLPLFVSEASATRYFHYWRRVPKATHSMLVKPDSAENLSHKYLVDWARERGFIDATISAAQTLDDDVQQLPPVGPANDSQGTPALTSKEFSKTPPADEEKQTSAGLTEPPTLERTDTDATQHLFVTAGTLTYADGRDKAFAKVVDIALSEKNLELAKRASEALTYTDGRDTQKQKIIEWLIGERRFVEATELANTLTYLDQRDEYKLAVLAAASIPKRT